MKIFEGIVLFSFNYFVRKSWIEFFSWTCSLMIISRQYCTSWKLISLALSKSSEYNIQKVILMLTCFWLSFIKWYNILYQNFVQLIGFTMKQSLVTMSIILLIVVMYTLKATCLWIIVVWLVVMNCTIEWMVFLNRYTKI